jgi:tRNA (guanine9-N1)-methyltransferase
MEQASTKDDPEMLQERMKESKKYAAVIASETEDDGCVPIDNHEAEPKSSSSSAAEQAEEKVMDGESGKLTTVPDQTSTKPETGKSGGGGEKPISKNQLRRQRKWELKMEVKRRRKEQEKEVKRAKANAEGRDIDAERRDMEERRMDGRGRARRSAAWKDKFDRDGGNFEICLDCSFEDSMTDREINSLAQQIRYCYATNKKAEHPVRVTVTSLSGATLDHLNKVSGFDHWTDRGFFHTAKSMEEALPEKSKLVYLTSDSNTVLERIKDDHIYVIGGIVDRNRLKRAAIDRAEAMGIATARLPIDNYFSMVTTKVLTCNHVFDTLVKFQEKGSKGEGRIRKRRRNGMNVVSIVLS